MQQNWVEQTKTNEIDFSSLKRVSSDTTLDSHWIRKDD